MATTRPTTDDLIGFLALQTPPSDDRRAVYDVALAAAVRWIESRVTLPATTDGAPTNAGNYPEDIQLAILLTASRLAKRSSSPEGVAGMSDIGQVVRIMGSDPDVERLIAFYNNIGFA